MASIHEAVNAAIEFLSSHPGEAQYRDSPAVARIESGLRVVTTGPDGSAATTDMTTGIGGGGTAPSPGWLFRAAIASCVATFVAMRAAQLERTIEALEVTVDSESNDLGLFDLDPDVPPGPLSMRINVTARFGPGSNGSNERDDDAAIVAWAVDHCPVVDAARRSVPVELELSA